MYNQGYIALHRKLLNWEWYRDVPTKTLFIHLLLSANHKAKKWQGIQIERGEFLSGRFELSKETGLSEQQIRTAIKKLKSTSEITIKSTNKNSIIKLVNYSSYQDKEEKSNQPMNQQDNQRPTNSQPTDNQQATTTNNENNDKNDNNKTTPKEIDKKYLNLSNGLSFVLKEKMQKQFSDSIISKWADEIRKLIEIDLKIRKNALDDVQKSIQAVSDNWGVKYFPTIQSGKSLREKFIKIENFLQRNKPNQTNKAEDKTQNNLSIIMNAQL